MGFNKMQQGSSSRIALHGHRHKVKRNNLCGMEVSFEVHYIELLIIAFLVLI